MASPRRPLLLLAGGAAVAAVALARARRRPAPLPAGPVASTSRAVRGMEMARLGGRAGGGYALHRARRTFASAERRDELDARFQLRTAEEVAASLGHMKGAMMKLGQMASYLDQGLPEPVRDALAQLQADAPSMAPELAAQVVEQELGAVPDALFAEWDPVPIAAASIGQVHRAMTHDGRAVAVKVQYPGIDDAIRADLGNAGMLFSAVGLLFPGLEPRPLVEELEARLVEELDYEREATDQRLFATTLRGHPFLHVPDVVGELSGRRVLTTELAEGARFEEVLGWDQEERDLAGESIFRFVFRCLYRLRSFNGDPHPGNYLFRPGGQVTFLDFGLVKHFTQPEIDVFAAMIEAMVLERDPGRFRTIIEAQGLIPADAPFSDERVEDYFGHFYEFVLDRGERTMTSEYATESVRRIFDASGPYADIMRTANLPPSFVIIQRINMGLYAILGGLGATRDWRGIADELWPFVDGPPSTELGRAEAMWLAGAPR